MADAGCGGERFAIALFGEPAVTALERAVTEVVEGEHFSHRGIESLGVGQEFVRVTLGDAGSAAADKHVAETGDGVDDARSILMLLRVSKGLLAECLCALELSLVHADGGEDSGGRGR
jgi:hypothetical protein